MRNILLFFLLLPTIAMAQLELPYSVKVLNPRPLDAYYFESDGTPYDNTGEVTTAIPEAVRYQGMTVNVLGVEYWWRDGVEDEDLVVKLGSPAAADSTNVWLTKSDTQLYGDRQVTFGGYLKFYDPDSHGVYYEAGNGSIFLNGTTFEPFNDFNFVHSGRNVFNISSNGPLMGYNTGVSGSYVSAYNGGATMSASYGDVNAPTIGVSTTTGGSAYMSHTSSSVIQVTNGLISASSPTITFVEGASDGGSMTRQFKNTGVFQSTFLHGTSATTRLKVNPTGSTVSTLSLANTSSGDSVVVNPSLITSPDLKITNIAAPSSETYMVTIDDEGNLSSDEIPSGGGVGSSSDTQFLFNDDGDVAGSANVTYDGNGVVTKRLTLNSQASDAPLVVKGSDTENIFVVTDANHITMNVVDVASGTSGNDAEGDILYRHASGYLVGLGIGSEDDVLTVSSGVPVWAAPSGGGGGGGGSVSSVGMTVPTGLSISGSPVTTSGTLAVTYTSGYQGYTSTEATKLSGIEASADVTDATNVAAAGAVMTAGTSTIDVAGATVEIEEGGDTEFIIKTDGSDYVQFGVVTEDLLNIAAVDIKASLASGASSGFTTQKTGVSGFGGTNTSDENFQLTVNPTTNAFVFTDSRTATVGIEYAADYSTDFTDRSFVDKEYVDNAVSGGGGITNDAAFTELMKSDGTDATTSGIFVSSEGSLDLGSGLSGSSRTIEVDGSATNVGLNILAKGTGTIAIETEGSPRMVGGAGPELRVENTSNSSVSPGAYISHTLSSGTPAAGIGAALTFRVQTATGGFNQEDGASIEAVTTDVTATSEDFDIVLNSMTAGAAATEKFRIKSTGVINIATAPTEDNTETNILVRDSGGDVQTRSAATIFTPTASTGSDVAFDIPRTYGYSADITGNITFTTTGLVEGITQLMIHNDSSEPSFEAGMKVISGSYVTGVDNYIMFMCVKSDLILVTISQE